MTSHCDDIERALTPSTTSSPPHMSAKVPRALTGPVAVHTRDLLRQRCHCCIATDAFG